MTQSRLTGLDLLRGIAAVCVVLFHAGHAEIGNAWLAVDFFFMLSGYVMARRYGETLGGQLGSVRFVALRFGRLWPTLFFATLIGLPLFAMTYGWQTTLIAMPNLILLPYLVGGALYPLNVPLWSIAFELVANAMHGGTIGRMGRGGKIFVVAGCLCVMLVVGIVSHRFAVGFTTDSMILGIPRVLLSYTLGVLLYDLWRDNPPVKVSPFVTLLAMPLYFGTFTAMEWDIWQADLAFVVVGCPLLIAGGLQFDRIPQFGAFLGAISFPLYAAHFPILTLIGYAGGGFWAMAIGGIAGGIAFHYAFEALKKPMSELICGILAGLRGRFSGAVVQ